MIPVPAGLLDLLLVATLVGLAWRVLLTPNLFKAVVLFIVFGLLMALTWARLAAPDIALAEAAIGAGLTGALLLDAAGQMQRRVAAEAGAEARSQVPGGEDGPTSSHQRQTDR